MDHSLYSILERALSALRLSHSNASERAKPIIDSSIQEIKDALQNRTDNDDSLTKTGVLPS